MDEFTRRMVEEARKAPVEMTRAEVGTMVAQAIFDHISLDHVLWAKVEERDGKFWGNVGFRVPPGFPDCLGTPDRMPRDSREAALGDIRGILSMTHMAAKMRVPGQAKMNPIFELDNVVIEMPAHAVERLGTLALLLTGIDLDSVKAQIDTVVGEISGGKPLDQAAWQRATDRQKLVLSGLMAISLGHGHFRHKTMHAKGEEPSAVPAEPG